jgi:hypothetical protein
MSYRQTGGKLGLLLISDVQWEVLVSHQDVSAIFLIAISPGSSGVEHVLGKDEVRGSKPLLGSTLTSKRET